MQYAFVYLTLIMLSVSSVGALALIALVLSERRASLLEGALHGFIAPAAMLTLASYLLEPSPLPLALGSLLCAAILGAMALAHRPVRML